MLISMPNVRRYRSRRSKRGDEIYQACSGGHLEARS